MLRWWNYCFVYVFGSGIFYCLVVYLICLSKIKRVYAHSFLKTLVGCDFFGLRGISYMDLFDSDCIFMWKKNLWMAVFCTKYYASGHLKLCCLKCTWCFLYLTLACQLSTKMITFFDDMIYSMFYSLLFILFFLVRSLKFILCPTKLCVIKEL